MELPVLQGCAGLLGLPLTPAASGTFRAGLGSGKGLPWPRSCLLSFPGLSHIGGSSPGSSPTDGTIGWCYASRRYPLSKLSSRTAIPFSFIPREFPALPGLFINIYRSLLYNSNVTFSSFLFSSYLSEWVIPFFGWKKALKNTLLWKAPHRGTSFLLCNLLKGLGMNSLFVQPNKNLLTWTMVAGMEMSHRVVPRCSRWAQQNCYISNPL